MRARVGVPALLAGLLVACAGPDPLPVLGSVPDFELTSQTGQTFEGKSLQGHVWIANFIFTNCPGPCPMMTAQMRKLQDSTADRPEVKLVSFTVDPARDTPPVLSEYASRFKAEPDRWYFLTGEQARLDDLGHKTFHLHNVDGSLSHSTRFVLIDRQSRIRGYYTSGDEDFMANLLRDVRRLTRGDS